MRLTSLKLSGFKSFVDPTSFDVPGQLVGVVGPNGCGKSNIIDAVRWVLGESKASELRGESMQDVIFNGSTHRKPAGRASVELVFDNADGKVVGQWGQYAEISVKRTLSRDGTSSYFINNQTVRRKDIQDIFLGTGLGPRAYAIIGQGMISRIIEAKPEELRIFLEEAAGVSKYKERRRETENRLKDTRDNLTRLEDILRELHTNLEKLEAQAEVAQRFHNLQGDQEEKQKLLWLLRKNEAKAEQDKFTRAVENAQLELEQQTAQLRHVEAELESLRQAHYDSGDRLHQAQGNLYQTNSEIGSLEAQIKYVIESRNRLQSQLQSLTNQKDQWQRQSAEFTENLNEAELQSEEYAVRVEQSQQMVQEYSERIPALEEEWRNNQSSSANGRAEIMQIQQQIELESAQQRNAAQNLSNLQSRRERLSQEKQGMRLPDDVHLQNVQMQLEEKKAQLEEVQMQLDDVQEKLPKFETEKRNAHDLSAKESAVLTQLEAKLSALKQLQESVQSQGKIQPWLEKNELTDLPRIWKKLHIEAGWETALESTLREKMSALEVSNLEWAKAFFNDAPPTKLALYTTKVTPIAATPAVDGLTPLISLLQLNDPQLRALMQDWLHGVYVVDQADEAFIKREQLPVGGCFVTKKGHLIGRSMVSFYAADSEQEGMLARQQEIQNLEKQQRAQMMLVDETKTKVTRTDAAVTQLMLQAQEYRQQIGQLTQSVHALQIELMKLSEVQERFNERTQQISTDLAEIEAQEAELQENKAVSEAKFEELDMKLAEMQEKFESNQTIYLEKEQQLNEVRQKLRELEREAQEVAFSEKSHRNKIEELKRNIATATEQSSRLAENMEQGALELEELDDQTAQAGLQSLLEKRAEQEQALANARHEQDQLSQQLRQFDENRLKVERDLQPQRDKITELQLKEQAARLNQEQYAQALHDTGADETELSTKLTDDMRPSQLQGEVTRLANAITALGAVNLAALEELSQASERKNFLDAQHADLTEAITTLEDAINKIDRETRELLQETFDKVNEHFAELFPVLFGGGQAKLIMTGDEILNAGVQVMAQPPGKKNATIHLLSGGEKALTATALVFSMFQLNPAPFCLLDEVDAPLDDANTERFSRMVEKMSANTQFLFISHNKIAMEMANQLIGVTMQEQGVSRIVAVDMETAINLAHEDELALN